ncbi:hypothetical protein HA402_009061 [Bradysia odoriphaga]|nr:hypothetical protein HA402_009061 [Bradysia odoriphaga]
MDPSKFFEDQMNQAFRKLANDVIPTDETAKNRCTANIIKLLQDKSRFKIGQVCIAGSGGKRTTIFSSDVDCVLFINEMRPPFKEVLNDFYEILTLTDSFNIRNVRTTQYTIQFTANGFDFDIQPAANFFAHCHNETGEHLSNEQQRRTLDIIKADPAKYGYPYSGSLAKATVQFMKEQNAFTHEMVRVAKFWYKTLYFDEYVSGAKSAIELVAVYAAGKERNYGSVSHLRCFGQVVKYLMHFDEMNIVFEKEYKFAEHQPVDGRRPRLLDPVNPYNNFASNWSRKSIELIKCFAKETNRRLQILADGKMAQLNVLFEPQPTRLAILSKVFPDTSHRSQWLVGSTDYNSLPDLKVHNEKFMDDPDRRMGVEILKDFFRTVAYSANASPNTGPVEVKTVIENLISSHVLNRKVSWVPASAERHEDFDVTFTVPCTNDKAVRVSYRL